MRIIDIANRIDKSKDNEDYIDITEFGYTLDLNLDWVEQDRLKSYWVGNWYCTDSYVGYKVYFFDDKPVAFSIQTGRKSDEIVRWFSKDLAIKVRRYLMSLMENDEERLVVDTCDINEDIGESYKIQFNAQILSNSKAMFNNETVEILERIRENPDYGIDRMLKIKFHNGEERVVSISELDFKYHLV